METERDFEYKFSFALLLRRTMENKLNIKTAKINQKVTKIQIEIRDNTGKVVSLNDNNTIVLRLDRAV